MIFLHDQDDILDVRVPARTVGAMLAAGARRSAHAAVVVVGLRVDALIAAHGEPFVAHEGHVRIGIETIERIAGRRPVGWMTGRPSANTRRLHLELGGFLYDRDSLSDELPYWVTVGGARHLVIPYSFETNDNRFDQNWGFSTGDDFAMARLNP